MIIEFIYTYNYNPSFIPAVSEYGIINNFKKHKGLFMKAKVITAGTTELENAINSWLAENKDIKIHSINTAVINGRNNEETKDKQFGVIWNTMIINSASVATILYEE